MAWTFNHGNRGSRDENNRRHQENSEGTIFMLGVQEEEPEGFAMQEETSRVRTMGNEKDSDSQRILKRSEGMLLDLLSVHSTALHSMFSVCLGTSVS